MTWMTPGEYPQRSRRQFLRAAMGATLAAGFGAVPAAPPLRAAGRWFLDAQDRVVFLRGFNLAGNSKVPPFRALDDASALDRLPAMGFNVVRLLFVWEAFEPSPGRYDAAYLDHIRWVAASCWARGMAVIVDIHQDGFARSLAGGCGDGFPLWAVSPTAHAYPPDNSHHRRDWALRMAADPGMHASWTEFFADCRGVRTRYLQMLATLAVAFANQPGVIGYDLLNEPWGNEKAELAPLYEDAARAIRAHHPSAILFVEGHITTNSGLQTRLPRPRFANFAYAPHYYKTATILFGAYHGGTGPIDRGFAHMTAKAAEWGVPLFLGEFGAPAGATRIGDYVGAIYDRLDSSLSSGAQWNYAPLWNPVAKDGWNGEDFNFLDAATGRTRPNFRPRPFPRAVAGDPIRFGFVAGDIPGRGSYLELAWGHRPERGDTEVYVPRCLFPPGSSVSVEPREASWGRDDDRQVVFVRNPRPEVVTLRVSS